MKWYFILGGVRNLLGIVVITLLTHAGVSLTMALFLGMLVGFSLYMLQVRYSVGKINFLLIAKMFALIFVANRALLWIFHENMGIPVFYAQLISTLLLAFVSHAFLKSSLIAPDTSRKY